jgi:hypothetical protein
MLKVSICRDENIRPDAGISSEARTGARMVVPALILILSISI